MKLLSVVQARAIWVGHTGDLNPAGRSNPDFLDSLKKRYGFAIAPDSIYAAIKTKKMAIFEQGTFTTKAGERIAVTLVIGDGYAAADTRSSTSDCDEFLEDFLSWTTKENGLVDFTKVFTTRTYVSNMQVSMEKSLDTINPKLANFASKVSKAISGLSPHDMEVGSVQFWPDTTLNSQPQPFRIERQQGTKPSENRYFSGAPLDTRTHLKLLAEFEELLG